MSNSTDPVDGLLQQQVKDGFWALNAYAPVFWCPFRSATCLEGDAVTVTASPCEFPSEGYFCQDVNNQGVYLDMISRQMEDCTDSVTSWFPISIILSAGMLIFLLYISCWRVCKLERISNSDQIQKGDKRLSSLASLKLWMSTRSFGQKKDQIPANNMEDIEQVDSQVKTAESNETVQSTKASCFNGLCGFFKRAKVSKELAINHYKLYSWPILEWLAELHLLLMSYQIISTLPASYYTAFPPLTTSVMRILSHLSLASPTTWPFSCFSSHSNGSNNVVPWPTFHFWNIMTLTTTIPIVLFLCISCVYVFLYELYFLASNEKRRRRGQERLSTWFFTACISGYCILIGPVAQLTIGSLNCVDVDPNKSTYDVETNVLWQDPTLVCAGSSYTYYRIWASLSIIIYLFFIPMIFGASVRCWRCTISVILNHAHRFALTSSPTPQLITDKAEPSTQSPSERKGVGIATTSSRTANIRDKQRRNFQVSEGDQTCSEDSHFSDSTLSSKASSTYFLVTGGDDVAQLKINQNRYDVEHASSSSEDGDMVDVETKEDSHRYRKKDPFQGVGQSDVNDQQAPLVHVKVSRTVRAAALLYTNFRQQYKYGILLEVFLRVFYMGILPNVVNPRSTSSTQALTSPFIGAVAACFMWMLLLQGKPYRRLQVQRLAELCAIQVLCVSLAAMLLQVEESSSSYVDHFSSSAWLLLDLVLMCILLLPTGYYIYHQWAKTKSAPMQPRSTTELASLSTDTASLSRKSDTKSMTPTRRHRGGNNKNHNWSPEYQWLREEFQRSHGLAQSMRPQRGMMSPSVSRKHDLYANGGYEDYSTSRRGGYSEQRKRNARYDGSSVTQNHSPRGVQKDVKSRQMQSRNDPMYSSMYVHGNHAKQMNRRSYSLSPSHRRWKETAGHPGERQFPFDSQYQPEQYPSYDDYGVLSEHSNIVSLPSVYRHALYRANVPHQPPFERSVSSNRRKDTRWRPSELYIQTQPPYFPHSSKPHPPPSDTTRNGHTFPPSHHVEEAVSDRSTAEEDEFLLPGRKQDVEEPKRSEDEKEDNWIPPPPSSPVSSKRPVLTRDYSLPLPKSPSRSATRASSFHHSQVMTTPKQSKSSKSPRTPPTRELYDMPRPTPSTWFEARGTSRTNNPPIGDDRSFPDHIGHPLQVANDRIGHHILHQNRYFDPSRSWFHDEVDGPYDSDHGRHQRQYDDEEEGREEEEEDEEDRFIDDVHALPTLSTTSSIQSSRHHQPPRRPVGYDHRDTTALTKSSHTIFM